MVGVGQAVNVQDGHRLHRPTIIDPEAARLHADRHDSIRQFAGQPIGHDRPIGVSRREHPAGVDVEPRRQKIQQEAHVFHVVDVSISGRTAAVSTIPRLQPRSLGDRTDPVGVHHQKVVRFGEFVETGVRRELIR